ncbi:MULTISPECIES: hypothetical protein [Streptococcus]|uniref:Uncharacterized protein n=1 Tax=Streptococcus caledonicus TaxID=2614158 RepID=A0ABW0UID9_9STRE|nr:hypothetical protein [Streptococcus sp. S784/96/1]
MVHTKQSAIFRGFYPLKILVLIFILIQYGKYYEVYDVIIYRIGKVYKLSPIPTEYEMKSKLPDLKRVRKCYNPLNPQEAYLPDNEGKWILS